MRLFALTGIAACACVAPVDLGGATSGVADQPPMSTALPKVATKLTNVAPTVNGDTESIDYDPVDDAVDKRV